MKKQQAGKHRIRKEASQGRRNRKPRPKQRQEQREWRKKMEVSTITKIKI